jgi:cell division protein ZapE
MAQSFPEIYAARVARGDLADDTAQRAVLPEFSRIAQALHHRPPRAGLFTRRHACGPARGLYLWGGVGRGKSMLMDLFFDTLDVEGRRRVHFHAFMQEVHAGIARARARGVDDAVAPVAADIAQGLRLLCFDEMQIGDITDAMIVGRVFEGLFAAGVVVVATSNRPPRDLYRDGLNRQLFVPFIEMLESRLAVVELASPRDWRQEKIAGRPVYFAPADRTARAAMDAFWDELTTAPTAPLRLKVAGRDVTLDRVSGGVARATFWELCDRPLGAADYLALAAAIRVLLLEDVPRMGAENYNQARRFVTLIDALYEGRVRLAMSAADVPGNLYVEGAGSFEFERTASRLREMQAADWGGDIDVGDGGDGGASGGGI